MIFFYVIIEDNMEEIRCLYFNFRKSLLFAMHII